MKNLFFASLVMLFFGSCLAHAQSSNSIEDRRSKAVQGIHFCSEEIIKDELGGNRGFELAAQLIEESFEPSNEIADLEQLAEMCEIQRDHLEPESTTDKFILSIMTPLKRRSRPAYDLIMEYLVDMSVL